MTKIKTWAVFLNFGNELIYSCSRKCKGCNYNNNLNNIISKISSEQKIILSEQLKFINKNIIFEVISLNFFGDYFVNYDFINNKIINNIIKTLEVGKFRFKMILDIESFYNLSSKDIFKIKNFIINSRNVDFELEIIIKKGHLINKDKLEDFFQNFGNIDNILFHLEFENKKDKIINNLNKKHEIFINSNNLGNQECLLIDNKGKDVKFLLLSGKKLMFHGPYCDKIESNDLGTIYDNILYIRKRIKIFYFGVKLLHKLKIKNSNTICEVCLKNMDNIIHKIEKGLK